MSHRGACIHLRARCFTHHQTPTPGRTKSSVSPTYLDVFRVPYTLNNINLNNLNPPKDAQAKKEQRDTKKSILRGYKRSPCSPRLGLFTSTTSEYPLIMASMGTPAGDPIAYPAVKSSVVIMVGQEDAGVKDGADKWR